MLYLGRNEKDRNHYITEIIDNGETFSIKFADGTVYDGYEKSEENLKTVIDVMTQQAIDARNDKMYFEEKAAKIIITSLATTTLSSWFIEEFGTNIMNLNIEQIIVATGTVIITGFATAGFLAYNNAEKLKEIEKLELYDYLQEDLESIKDYPHALQGLSKGLKEFVKNTKNPFSIINSDQYTTEDLRKISKNISREKSYCKKLTEKN